MTTNDLHLVEDPTLYRALAFAAWSPREAPDAARQRLLCIEQVLRQLKWLPTSATIPDRSQLAWIQRKLWDDWETAADWNLHRFAQTYHETLVVLLGVEQDGSRPSPHDWGLAAREQWSIHFGRETFWEPLVALPQDAEPEKRPRLLGQAWVWTGEWGAIPSAVDEDWTGFGAKGDSHGSFIQFPWGILSYQAGSEDELPCFEVHTTIVEKQGRDLFLFSSLPVILAEFVKATQFLLPRYERDLAPDLNKQEAAILEQLRPQQGGHVGGNVASQLTVLTLTELLAPFAQRIGDLEEDARSTEIARDAIARVVEDAHAVRGGAAGGVLAQPADWLAQQMRSDLAYYHTTADRARNALAAQRTLVEIEQTRVQERLAVIGVVLMGLAVFVGLVQVLQDLSPIWRLLIGVGGGLAWSYIAWRLGRRTQ